MQTLFLSYRFRKELKEGCSSGAQPQVAQFVHHHKVISVVGFEHPGEAVLVLGQEEFLGQGQGGGETDRIACGDAGCGNADGHMGLAGARVSQKDKVLLAAKEVSLGQKKGDADVFLDSYATKSKLLGIPRGSSHPNEIFILLSLYQHR